MAKYSKKAQDKIGDVMHEYKHGELESGPGGKGGKVRSREQAVAIALSEARAEGAKVPKAKKSASKTTSKKAKTSDKKASSKSSTKSKSSAPSARKTTTARKSRASVRGSKSSPGSKSAASRKKRKSI
jgi:hypothetical protein